MTGRPQFPLAVLKTSSVQKCLWSALALLLLPTALRAQSPAAAPGTVNLSAAATGRLVPDEFLGLSFEMQRLLPGDDGRYYFRPDNEPLLALVRTLGIKCLRVGGNTADRPTVRFPSMADIDSFFAFARQAGVKVIFTLRLREGDPRQAAAVVSCR